jgi:hypothetical protein
LVLSYGDEVEFFRLEYGPPQDCPAGCFFDSIVGVRSSTNLGWLHPRLDEVADADYFDVRETDSVLWTEELWAELESTDQGVFWSGLMPTLAADPSTDREALLRIAERIETFITPHVGWELLENPSVESDREILTRLSQLPVYQGDTYEPIRSKASELLDGLAG